MSTPIETAHGSLNVPAQYTHLATVRGCLDIPVRREANVWFCMFAVDLGLAWSGADVTDVRPIDADNLETSRTCPKCDWVRARKIAEAGHQ